MTMDLDPYSLVVAINNLNDTVKAVGSQSNIFKDYILPIGGLIFSGVVGYAIAIQGYKWQERVQNERLKVDAVNRTILMLQTMQGNLCAIKSNYYDKLDENPIQRMGEVLNIIFDETPVYIEKERLLQVVKLVKRGGVNYKLRNWNEKKEIEDLDIPWLKISNLIVLEARYNQLMKIISTRNLTDLEFKNKITQHFKNKVDNELSLDTIINIVGLGLTQKYCDLTEVMILKVDNLLIEIDDCLRSYPGAISKQINKKYLNNYSVIKSYKNDFEIFKTLLKRTTSLDIETMAVIMNMDVNEATSIYKNFDVTITKTI